MEENKKVLLNEQIKKVEEVLATLSNNFKEETEEEINFLNVIKGNLQNLAN